MKITYLIDSDWIIDHLLGIKKTTQQIKAYRKDGISVSIISVAEIYEGVFYSKNPS